MRDGIDWSENVIKYSNEEINEEDVSHQEVHGHDGGSDPTSRMARDLALATALGVNVTGKYFTIEHEVWLEKSVNMN